MCSTVQNKISGSDDDLIERSISNQPTRRKEKKNHQRPRDTVISTVRASPSVVL